jgi:hypothetical protein
LLHIRNTIPRIRVILFGDMICCDGSKFRGKNDYLQEQSRERNCFLFPLVISVSKASYPERHENFKMERRKRKVGNKWKKSLTALRVATIIWQYELTSPRMVVSSSTVTAVVPWRPEISGRWQTRLSKIARRNRFLSMVDVKSTSHLNLVNIAQTKKRQRKAFLVSNRLSSRIVLVRQKVSKPTVNTKMFVQESLHKAEIDGILMT